jgi:hypothetical protein
MSKTSYVNMDAINPINPTRSTSKDNSFSFARFGQQDEEPEGMMERGMNNVEKEVCLDTIDCNVDSSTFLRTRWVRVCQSSLTSNDFTASGMQPTVGGSALAFVCARSRRGCIHVLVCGAYEGDSMADPWVSLAVYLPCMQGVFGSRCAPCLLCLALPLHYQICGQSLFQQPRDKTMNTIHGFFFRHLL